MDDWIQLCVLLQEVDRWERHIFTSLKYFNLQNFRLCPRLPVTVFYLARHQRRQGLHVEYESDSWEVATNLLLDLESVSTTLIGAALLPALDKLDIPTVGDREGNSARSLRVMLSDLRLEAAEKMLLKGLEALVYWYQGLDEKRKGVLIAPPDCVICGYSAYLPGERVFRVSREAVSIHIPVHRMIAKVVLFSAMGNVPKATMFTEYVRSNPECVTILVDFPVRCLVFAAQIRLGMWRRNGITVENIGHNYSRMPVCRTLQDADIVALQWGIYCNSFCFSENNNLNSIFALLLRRFEVLGLLSKSIPEFEGLCASVGKPGSQQALAAVEYSGGLLAELFRLLIIVVTYVPTPLYTSVVTAVQSLDSSESTGNHEHALPVSPRPFTSKSLLSREIAHLVLSGETKRSRLSVCKAMLGREEIVSDDDIAVALGTVCDTAQDSVDRVGRNRLKLKKEGFDLFDPEFLHLSYSQQEVR